MTFADKHLRKISLLLFCQNSRSVEAKRDSGPFDARRDKTAPLAQGEQLFELTKSMFILSKRGRSQSGRAHRRTNKRAPLEERESASDYATLLAFQTAFIESKISLRYA